MSHDCTTASPAGHRGDVPVTGGDPAGSTTATLRAEKGLQATPLEKAPPRFRVGESRLPVPLNSRSPEAAEEVGC